MMHTVLTAGGFDAMDSHKIRFLHEASKSGQLHIAIFDDSLIQSLTGAAPKFSLAERHYFVENIRYAHQVYPINSLNQLKNVNDLVACNVNQWLYMEAESFPEVKKIAAAQEIPFSVMDKTSLTGFPEHDYDASDNTAKKVIVTGCFDWFHTGHVRFFEEASEYGDLYVILGHDKNITLLKGDGHPMFCEQERKYIAGSIRFVRQAMISSGDGWLDAEPEILHLKPDRYVVNEDGDKPVKREYCVQHGIEYTVLKREPKPGLTRRTSTNLRDGYLGEIDK